MEERNEENKVESPFPVPGRLSSYARCPGHRGERKKWQDWKAKTGGTKAQDKNNVTVHSRGQGNGAHGAVGPSSTVYVALLRDSLPRGVGALPGQC